MFLQRFIRVPVDLYDKEKSDVIGQTVETFDAQVYLRINPFEISHYREARDDNDEYTLTVVCFRNGENFVVALTIEEFEKILGHV